MKTINIGSITARAWNLAIDNWPIFILLAIVKNIVTSIGTSLDAELLQEYNLARHPEMFSVALDQALHINPWIVSLGFLLGMYLSIVTFKMLVNCARTGKPYESMADVFSLDFVRFAFFLGVSIVLSLAIIITALLGGGIVAAIVFATGLPLGWSVVLVVLGVLIPTFYITIRLAFAPIIIATEQVPFLDAFRLSWRLTNGVFWKLLLLLLASCGVIILGLCACIVGVILAQVVVNFMFALAYTDLKDANDEPAADIAAPVMESYEK